MSDSLEDGVGLHVSSGPDKTQIHARPEPAGAKKAVQLPFRLLLVSDLDPEATPSDWSGASRIRRVDKHTFDGFLEELSPRLHIDVPDRRSAAPRMLEIDLAFSSLKAFHPAQLAAQVPEVAGLLEIRQLAGHAQAGTIDPASLRSRLEESGVGDAWAARLQKMLSAPDSRSRRKASGSDTEPRKKAGRPQTDARRRPGGDPLDRLLDMVDLGAGAAEQQDESMHGGASRDTLSGDAGAASEDAATSGGASRLTDALMRAISDDAAAGPKLEKSAADSLLGHLDETLAIQVNDILNHPSVRRLEAAWRGLRFVVDRIDFRERIELEVLPVGKAALSEALYHQVLLPEHGDSSKTPLSAIVLDAAFDNERADVELLEDLAESAASLQVPLLASVAPPFFGIDAMEEASRLPVLRQLLDGPEYLAWNKLRDRADSSYLTLVLPPFLLRYAYGPDRPVAAFPFEENGALFGSGALAVAVVIASRFARTGWPTHLEGESRAVVEDLPIWKTRSGAIPLGALLSEERQDEFADAGFAVLGCRPNHDAAYLARAPTVHRPDRYEDAAATAEARAHDTLACRLFVSRAAHFLLALQQEVAPGRPLAETETDVAARLRSFLSADGSAGSDVPEEAVSVEHVPEASSPEHDVLAVRLQPPADLLNPPVSLVLGLQLPKGR
jgi:type VI secretion system protein ImpC